MTPEQQRFNEIANTATVGVQCYERVVKERLCEADDAAIKAARERLREADRLKSIAERMANEAIDANEALGQEVVALRSRLAPRLARKESS